MKKEKGEAAFDSADEVLTDRIINTTETHGRNNETSSPDSSSDCSYDTEFQDQDQEKTGQRRGKWIIIAACAGIVLLLIGIFLFSRRKFFRGN